ncbi:MAG: hypothetical protein HC767_12155 [Akkermansiaceae bacterium]|nr:hypothetical protein [Akkermansiaceae bacterium]
MHSHILSARTFQIASSQNQAFQPKHNTSLTFSGAGSACILQAISGILPETLHFQRLPLSKHHLKVGQTTENFQARPTKTQKIVDNEKIFRIFPSRVFLIK